MHMGTSYTSDTDTGCMPIHSPFLFTLTFYIWFLLGLAWAWACSAFEGLYKQPMLRLSPTGHSLQWWPEHVQRSFWAMPLVFMNGCALNLEASAAVHGAKVRVKHA